MLICSWVEQQLEQMGSFANMALLKYQWFRAFRANQKSPETPRSGKIADVRQGWQPGNPPIWVHTRT